MNFLNELMEMCLFKRWRKTTYIVLWTALSSILQVM